jgi:hypothetical protein
MLYCYLRPTVIIWAAVILLLHRAGVVVSRARSSDANTQGSIQKSELFALESIRFNELIERKNKKELDFDVAGFYHIHSTFQKKMVEDQLRILDGWRNTDIPLGNGFTMLDEKNNNGPNLLTLSEFLYVDIEKKKDEDVRSVDVENIIINKISGTNQGKIDMHILDSVDAALFQEMKAKKQEESVLLGQLSTLNAMHKYCVRINTESLQQARSNPGSQKKRNLVYFFHTDDGDDRPDDPFGTWIATMNAFNLEFPSICMRALLNNNYVTCGIEYQDGHYR